MTNTHSVENVIPYRTTTCVYFEDVETLKIYNCL